MVDRVTKARIESIGANTASENRKLRNRLSQKAFRARQAVYIKELERRLENVSKTETERTTELETENAFYRDELLGFHKKLESLKVGLQNIADSVAEALNIESCRPVRSCNKDRGGSPCLPPSPTSSDTPEGLDSSMSLDLGVSEFQDVLDFSGSLSLDDNIYLVLDNVIEEIPRDDRDLVGALDVTRNRPPNAEKNHEEQANASSTPANQRALLPRTTTKAFTQSPLNSSLHSSQCLQMGPGRYASIADAGPIIFSDDKTKIRCTNSGFSDHINTVEHFLREKWQTNESLAKRDDFLSNSVAFMISIFVSTSWAPMTAFYNYTKCHYQVNKLTTWRLNPTTKSYTDLAPCYRPTQLQLSIPHPSVIDWTPFPTMRDRLILYHASNPQLDDIICEIGNSYVIETDLSKLIAGVSSVTGYISVWDLVRAISPDTSSSAEEDYGLWGASLDGSLLEEECTTSSLDYISFLSNAPATLPAPSIQALFNSRTLALQAFNLLEMNKGTTFFRIDPVFFERHPEMYDSQADIVAHGISIRPLSRQALPAPGPVNSGTLKRYGEMTTWSFGMELGNELGPEAVGA